MNRTQYTDEEIIKGYLALCYNLGRVATKKDIDDCKTIPHTDTIKSRFGTIANFRKISGINKNGELSGKLLKEEVEKILITKRIQRGRRLDCMEVNADKELPNVNYIRCLYSNKFLREIWDEIENKLPSSIADYLGI